MDVLEHAAVNFLETVTEVYEATVEAWQSTLKLPCDGAIALWNRLQCKQDPPAEATPTDTDVEGISRARQEANEYFSKGTPGTISEQAKEVSCQITSNAVRHHAEPATSVEESNNGRSKEETQSDRKTLAKEAASKESVCYDIGEGEQEKAAEEEDGVFTFLTMNEERDVILAIRSAFRPCEPLIKRLRTAAVDSHCKIGERNTMHESPGRTSLDDVSACLQHEQIVREGTTPEEQDDKTSCSAALLENRSESEGSRGSQTCVPKRQLGCKLVRHYKRLRGERYEDNLWKCVLENRKNRSYHHRVASATKQTRKPVYEPTMGTTKTTRMGTPIWCAVWDLLARVGRTLLKIAF